VSALDVVRETLRPHAFPAAPSAPEAASLAREVAAAGAGEVLAVLFFGSRRTGAAGSDRFSAYDLFVVVSGYRGFYAALAAAGQLRRSPGLVAWLNTWLAPNQVSFRGSGDRIGKLSVVTRETFLRETSPLRRDHFCAGRLFQPAEVVFAEDAAGAELALEGLAQAHALTLAWSRPWLPESFDAAAFTRRLLAVSLAQEIRPEPGDRAGQLWEAQSRYLLPVYGRLLMAWADAGELLAAGEGGYRLARPVDPAEAASLRRLFRRSKLRATLRWFKYMLTFDDWLAYIQRKVERHTGQPIVLTSRERRWPLVFLWPRVFRYLRDKDRRP
jgi:hypothetical protein